MALMLITHLSLIIVMTPLAAGQTKVNESTIKVEKNLGLTIPGSSVLITTVQSSTLTEVRLSFPKQNAEMKNNLDTIIGLVEDWPNRAELNDVSGAVNYMTSQLNTLKTEIAALKEQIDKFYSLFNGVTNDKVFELERDDCKTEENFLEELNTINPDWKESLDQQLKIAYLQLRMSNMQTISNVLTSITTYITCLLYTSPSPRDS